MSTSQYSRKIRSEYHRAGERLSLERLYLRNIIYYLEHRQISESIRYIKDVYNFADNNKYYEVLFDESVTKSTVLLEEQYIKSINRQRELNILGIHSAAHKSIKPFYSHNVCKFFLLLIKTSLWGIMRFRNQILNIRMI